MSQLSYTARPRYGTGWARLLYVMALIVLIGVSLFTVGRVFLGARADKATTGPRSVEERLLQDAYEAVSQDPASAKARWELSLALSTVGDHEGARKEAENAVRADKGSVEPYYALGIAYRGLGDLERAEKALVKAASLPGSFGETYREVYYDLGELRMKREDYKGAVEAFESALGNGPEATYVVVSLADAYQRSGNKKRAKEEYLAVLGYDPENVRAAEALESMGVSDAEIEKARNPIAHQPAAEAKKKPSSGKKRTSK
ncbi:MAG: tetratricopeptide repeat protein [Coriobacteriales bacterium]|nr:tetratricopeptide repeat protein [Coriobacteriales bacterium]